MTNPSLDNVRSKNRHNLIDVFFSMDVQVDWLGQVKAEDTHDGFCVDNVSSGNKIEVIAELCNIIYERFYLIDRV